jgi:hypothetical protein
MGLAAVNQAFEARNAVITELMSELDQLAAGGQSLVSVEDPNHAEPI